MSSDSAPCKTQSDDCSICLNALTVGASLLTLSCGHKFHLQCLISNVQAQNKECPLCRTTIDDSLIKMLETSNQSIVMETPSVEDPVDGNSVAELSNRIAIARQAALSSYSTADIPLITASTTLEYEGQTLDQQSNIYGLVTLRAPSAILPSDNESVASAHVPIDLICVVDQSGSMGRTKMALLKRTLIYIIEQMNELDRLAIISFNRTAHDRSHGLKRMNEENRTIIKHAIENDISSRGETFIGSGLQMAVQMFNNRQMKNPLGALLLLTDGRDSRPHDYNPIMQTLPDDIQCHTFGYGSDHTPALLAQLADQGHGGTFTYIDEVTAVGPAFAMALGGLFTCVAQQIHVNIQFEGEYQITRIHSKYSYEPTQLPSSQIQLTLNNLNVDETRNLVFQLHVAKIENNNPDPMSQDPSEVISRNDRIGQVSLTYIDPNSHRTLHVEPVPFHLIRIAQPSAEHLQVNYTLDIQRNRVETADVLKRAMEEHDYLRSLAILRKQIEKIQASVSATDPFCQNLIKDLRYRYSSEKEYRSCNHTMMMQHRTERGTYMPSSITSTISYQSDRQRSLLPSFRTEDHD